MHDDCPAGQPSTALNAPLCARCVRLRRVRLACASKALHAYGAGSKDFWKEVFGVWLATGSQLRSFLSFLAARKPRVLRLQLEVAPFKGIRQLAAALAGAPLRSLEVAGGSAEGWGGTEVFSCSALQQLPQLEELCITGGYGTHVVADLAHLTALTKASFNRSAFPPPAGPHGSGSPRPCVPAGLLELELGSAALPVSGLGTLLGAATGLRLLACSQASQHDYRSDKSAEREQAAAAAADLGRFQHLTRLELENWELVGLPESLAALTKLQRLGLQGSTKSIPPGSEGWAPLGRLAAAAASLTSLDLSHGGGAPAELSSLRSLRELDVSHPPYEMPLDLRPVSALSSLTALDTSYSYKLGAGSLGGLAGLASLRRLTIAHSRLAGADTQPLARLERLTFLDMTGCGLGALPPELGALHALLELSLEGEGAGPSMHSMMCKSELLCKRLCK